MNNNFVTFHFDENKETVLDMMDNASSKVIRQEDKILFPLDNNYLTVTHYEEKVFVVKPFEFLDFKRYGVACAVLAKLFNAEMINPYYYGDSVKRESIIAMDSAIIENLEAIVNNRTPLEINESMFNPLNHSL